MPWRLNAVQACKEGYFQSGLHTIHAHMDGGGGVEKTHNKLKKYTFLHIPLVILQMYDYKMHADIHAQQHTYTEKKQQPHLCLLHLLQNLHMTTVRSDRIPSYPISI